MRKTLKKIILKIITWEARMALSVHQPNIVGITGSVGKTSTKEAIYTVLSSKYRTRKSKKSFNSEFGVPLTILDLDTGWDSPWAWIKNISLGLLRVFFSSKFPEWLVLEIGADHPGDIQEISKWLSLDVAVFTQMSDVPSHIEFYSSIEEVLEEKSYLAKMLRGKGVLVVNNDDEKMDYFRNIPHQKIFSFGFEEGASVVASNEIFSYKNDRPTGIVFKANHGGNSIPVHILGSLGRQHIYPVLASIAVGLSQNMNSIEIAEALKDHRTPSGRMRLIDGVKDSLIIDDTYNSSPIACQRALEVLEKLECRGRKIAVLGDMLELGIHSKESHHTIGKMVGKVADLVAFVGSFEKFFAEGARRAGKGDEEILEFINSDSAKNELERLIEPGDIILVKGSQGVRMEKIVEEIMANPEEKENLLVRQEDVWKKK